MQHTEIRFRILLFLYEKYYSGKPMHYFSRDTIIKESGLADEEKNLVLGDMLYITSKKLVNATRSIGDPYPTDMYITAQGIDVVHSVVDNSIEDILNSNDVDSEHKEKVKELSKEIPTIKSQKLIDYLMTTVHGKAEQFLLKQIADYLFTVQQGDVGGFPVT